MTSDSVRTAILLGGGVREAVMAQPVLRALPGATIFAGPEAIGTLLGLPGMGRGFILDGSPGSWMRAYRRLRGGTINRVVLTPPTAARSAALAYFSGLPQRIMIEGSHDWAATDRVRGTRGLHPVDANHRLAELAAVKTGTHQPPTGPSDLPTVRPPNTVRQRAADRWPEVSARQGGYLVIVPGRGSWSQRPTTRTWAPERFAVVANQSPAERVILLAGFGDEGIVRETRTGIGKPTIVVTLLDATVEEAAVVGQGAIAVIGHDSDALHVAAAAGAPVLVLLGRGDTPPKGPRVTSLRVDDFERFPARTVVEALERHLQVTSYA